jgi:glycosyltransferase involved in cell wall biosynthesis
MLATVIIPNFNYGRYLPDALASVFSQSHRPLQLIVADDGSVDDSQRIITNAAARARQAQVEYEWHFITKNRGKLGALNSVMSRIRGHATCILDADDILFPNFIKLTLERLLEERAGDPRVAFVYTDCRLVDAKAGSLGRGKSTTFSPFLLERVSFIPECGLTITDVLKQAAPFDETVRVGTKHHKWLRIVRNGARGVHLPIEGFSYRIHESNLSGINRRLFDRGAIRHEDRLLSGYWPTSSDLARGNTSE